MGSNLNAVVINDIIFSDIITIIIRKSRGGGGGGSLHAGGGGAGGFRTGSGTSVTQSTPYSIVVGGATTASSGFGITAATGNASGTSGNGFVAGSGYSGTFQNSLQGGGAGATLPLGLNGLTHTFPLPCV